MSKSPNDGGPAFPVHWSAGMSLRDYFAGQALAALAGQRTLHMTRDVTYARGIITAVVKATCELAFEECSTEGRA